MFEELNLEKFMQKNLLYITEEQRRQSFKKWIFSEKQPCSATKMAEAGFIFIGDKDAPDAVKCFLCEKTLDGWDPKDDPWTEHIDHSSNCSFAKLRKHQELLTLEEFLDIKQELVRKTVNKYFDKLKEIVDKKLLELEKLTEKRLKKLT